MNLLHNDRVVLENMPPNFRVRHDLAEVAEAVWYAPEDGELSAGSFSVTTQSGNQVSIDAYEFPPGVTMKKK
jgi:hypothetical protein